MSKGDEVERRGHDELAETRPFCQQGGLHGTFSFILPWAAYLDSISRHHMHDRNVIFPQDRLEHLRKQCGPHVASVAKDSVEGICSKIYHISAEYVRRLHQAHLTLLKECNISGRSWRCLCIWKTASEGFIVDKNRPAPKIGWFFWPFTVGLTWEPLWFILVALKWTAQSRRRSRTGWCIVILPDCPSRLLLRCVLSCTSRTTLLVCGIKGKWWRSTAVISTNWCVYAKTSSK